MIKITGSSWVALLERNRNVGSQHTLAVTDCGTLYYFGKDLKDWNITASGETSTSQHIFPPALFGNARVGRWHLVQASHALAFAMATHPRLGAASGLLDMSADLVHHVVARTACIHSPEHRWTAS